MQTERNAQVSESSDGFRFTPEGFLSCGRMVLHDNECQRFVVIDGQFCCYANTIQELVQALDKTCAETGKCRQPIVDHHQSVDSFYNTEPRYAIDPESRLEQWINGLPMGVRLTVCLVLIMAFAWLATSLGVVLG